MLFLAIPVVILAYFTVGLCLDHTWWKANIVASQLLIWCYMEFCWIKTTIERYKEDDS